MPLKPPTLLGELLASLGLAGLDDLRAVEPRVKRVTRSLPPSVRTWLDALVEAQIVSAYQSGEILAGRGLGLRAGPYLLVEPLDVLGWAEVFRARSVVGEQLVRITTARLGAGEFDRVDRRLAEVVQRSKHLQADSLSTIKEYGQTDGRVWAATDHIGGDSVAEWTSVRGRLAPNAVIEIVRQVVGALQTLAAVQLTHGDVSARQLLFAGPGWVRLTNVGLRGAVRPVESVVSGISANEVFDYLAPERLAGGASTIEADIFAVGILGWRLLAGQLPSAKLRGTQGAGASVAARAAELTRLAPETPPLLVDFVAQCLGPDPGRRPLLSEWTLRLGPSTRSSQQELARWLEAAGATTVVRASSTPGKRLRSALARVAAAGSGLALIAAAGTWPHWQSSIVEQFAASSPNHQVVAPLVARLDSTQRSRAEFPRTALAMMVAKPVIDERPGPWPGSYWVDRDLVLDSHGPVHVGQWTFDEGQTVRAADGHRATVIVPADGWRLSGPAVRMVNLDMIASQTTPSALVELAASRAEFVACTWQGASTGESQVAVNVVPPADTAGASESSSDPLWIGSIQWTDCVLQRVSAGVRYNGRGHLSVELSNVLYLGPGPLVRLDSAPRRGDRLEIFANRLTLRESRGLVVCRYEQLPADPGRLCIDAVASVFMPSGNNGLVGFEGASQPSTLLESLIWRGQGTILARQSPLAVWRDATGQLLGADDSAVDVSGLERDDVNFEGPAETGPGSSRLVRRPVPLRSSQPPGINVERPLPGGGWR